MPGYRSTAPCAPCHPPAATRSMGAPFGWQSLITTLGCSLLASGERLFVMDFSETDASSLLFLAASHAGASNVVQVLPRDIETVDVFGGMDSTAVADVLVESLHADGADADRRARSIDHRIVGAASRCSPRTSRSSGSTRRCA